MICFLRVCSQNVLCFSGLALFGCVPTESEAVEEASMCTAQPSALDGSGSIVLVRGDLEGAGLTLCSGVLVSPRLALTHQSCLVLPSEVDAADLVVDDERPSFDGRELHSGDVDYASTCRVDAGWDPLESGDFAAWLGQPLDPATVTVSVVRDGAELASTTVQQILLPHAASRCWDILAAMVLEDELPAVLRPVRVMEVTAPGDAVTIGAFSVSLTEPQFRDAVVEAVTLDTAAAGTPPRSLELSRQVCFSEPGGAVVSDSGAIIGLIGYGTGAFCGDPEGRTIATRLAPFRRMLLDAAREAGDRLPVEAAQISGVGGAIPACVEP